MGRRKHERRAVVAGVGAVRGAGEDGAQQGAAVHATFEALVFNKLPVGRVDDEDGCLARVKKWGLARVGIARVISWRVDGFYF